jgi:hypothetical protein
MNKQFWLARLDQYGNPTLIDGAHEARSGVEKAMYLFDRLHPSEGNRYACAEVIITPVDAKQHGANEGALLSLRSSVKTVGVDVADTCDGVEQEAFEAWAKAAGHDMHEHPMHYLFLDPKTDAARHGWKAGITHARQRILSALEAPAAEKDEVDPKRWREHIGNIDGLVSTHPTQQEAASEVTDQAIHDADTVSLMLSQGKRIPRGMIEDLRNHVRKLTAALKGDRP